jgi:hypothetical protein
MNGRWLRAAWTGGMLTMSALPAGHAARTQQVTYVQVVKPADSGLEWALPAAIPFGTALSSTQLSATAKVGGTFVYSPGAGVIPDVGTQTLSVTFTPADSSYKPALASVSIVVEPPGPSSFDLAYTPANPQDPTDVAVSPAQPTQVGIHVQPLGDFHQPVSLSCASSNPYLHCALSDEVVRPTTSAVPVTVTIRMSGSSAEAAGGTIRLRLRGVAAVPGGNGRRPALFGSAAAATALACVLLLRARYMRRRAAAIFGSMAALLLTGGLLFMSGCGVGFASSQLTITASSLTETKTLVFDIYQVPTH